MVEDENECSRNRQRRRYPRIESSTFCATNMLHDDTQSQVGLEQQLVLGEKVRNKCACLYHFRTNVSRTFGIVELQVCEPRATGLAAPKKDCAWIVISTVVGMDPSPSIRMMYLGGDNWGRRRPIPSCFTISGILNRVAEQGRGDLVDPIGLSGSHSQKSPWCSLPWMLFCETSFPCGSVNVNKARSDSRTARVFGKSWTSVPELAAVL